MDKEKTPSSETMAAIAEVQKMKVDTDIGKTYSSAEEMVKSLLTEEDRP